LVVWKNSAESCGPSERNSPAIDPRGDRAEGSEQEGPADRPWHVRALRGQARTGARGDRLGHQPDAGQRGREQREQRDVRQDARGGQQLDQRRRDEDPEAEAGGASDAVGEADADGVAPGMELEQRGAGRADGRARRQTLEGTGDE
jgi:hypothetical protein